MANIFDQFDPPATSSAQPQQAAAAQPNPFGKLDTRAVNVFDQFDAPQTPMAAALEQLRSQMAPGAPTLALTPIPTPAAPVPAPVPDPAAAAPTLTLTPVSTPAPKAPNVFDQYDAPAANATTATPVAPSGATGSTPAPNAVTDDGSTALPTVEVSARPAAVVQQEYQQLPWYQQPIQAAGDIGRLITDGATFGFGDKLAAWLNGDSTDAERAKTQEASERAGIAGPLADFTGALMAPTGVVGGAVKGLPVVGSEIAKGLASAADMKGFGGLAARTGVAAARGAGYGAAGAAGHDQSIGDGALIGTILGGVVNPVAELGGKIVSGTASLFNPKSLPVPDQIQQAVNAAKASYAAADNAGVIFTPQATGRLQSAIVQNLTDMGYDPALQPGAAAVVSRLNALQGKNVTLTGLDTLRKVAANGFIPGNNGNNKAISGIIGAIDDAVANPQTGDVMAGNATAGAQALNQARALWARVARATDVSNAIDAAELNAASSGAGGNVNNAARQSVKAVYNNARGLTNDEDDAFLDVIKGTPTGNALRLLGKFAPTGNVSMGLSGGAGAMLGSMIGGPVGAGVGAVGLPAIGQAAKMASDRMTQGHVNDLLNIIMAGGSRAAALPTPNIVQKFAQARTSAIADALTRAVLNRAYSPRGNYDPYSGAYSP